MCAVVLVVVADVHKNSLVGLRTQREGEREGGVRVGGRQRITHSTRQANLLTLHANKLIHRDTDSATRTHEHTPTHTGTVSHTLT